MNSPTLTVACDADGHDHRHRRLHGARAGTRQTRRSPRRHLGVRRRPLRDADRPSGVRRRRRVDHAGERAEGRSQMARAAGRSADAALSTAASLSGEGAEATFERDWRRAARARGARTDACGPATVLGRAGASRCCRGSGQPSRGSRSPRLRRPFSGRRRQRRRAPASHECPFFRHPARRSTRTRVGVAVSPDGTMVAFVVGSVARSENELWVRSLDSMSSRRLEGHARRGLAVLVTGRPSHRILHEFQAEDRHRCQAGASRPWPTRRVAAEHHGTAPT